MKSVLLVDDDQDIRRILSFTFGVEGYDVITADNGVEGLRLATEVRPDVMVLDVMMPDVDGFTVLERLREHPLTRDIRVLLLSARSGDDDVWAGWQAGADCYLTKPFDVDQLLSFIAED